MSEIVQGLVNSPLLYTITVLLVVILAKTGVLKIHTNNVSLGITKDKERSIIRNQIEYAQAFCRGMLRHFPDDSDRYRQLYIIEMIYNEITSIISFNHLSISPEYIKVKQAKIWNIASTVRTDLEQYQTEEFKELIFNKTENLIKDLFEIRKMGERENK